MNYFNSEDLRFKTINYSDIGTLATYLPCLNAWRRIFCVLPWKKKGRVILKPNKKYQKKINTYDIGSLGILKLLIPLSMNTPIQLFFLLNLKVKGRKIKTKSHYYILTKCVCVCLCVIGSIRSLDIILNAIIKGDENNSV